MTSTLAPDGDGPLSVQVTIRPSAGPELLTQRILRLGPGSSGPRSPGTGTQEILYVVSGAGTLHLNGEHSLEPDSAAYVLPADTYAIEDSGPRGLLLVSVLTPLDREVNLGPERQWSCASGTDRRYRSVARGSSATS